MTTSTVQTGTAPVNGAQLYYEVAGTGTPFVMIHAGVADSRQWNNEFAYFAQQYRALRFDLRGFGRSEPVAGEYSHLGDLSALLEYLVPDGPLILMGCSMGGGLAMDYALTHPAQVAALIMVGSGPSGLEIDAPEPAKFAEVEQASQAGDLDLVAELETQIWFDGMNRTPAQVDPIMRRLAYAMNRNALALEARGLGTRVPGTATTAAGRLGELSMPVLAIVGDNDLPYLLLAADIMAEQIAGATKVLIADAAHLPNLDQPAEFQRIVAGFLEDVRA